MDAQCGKQQSLLRGFMTRSSTTNALRIFDAVYHVYTDAICKIDPVRAADRLLDSTTMLAGFASGYHPGRFVDGTIENLLLKTGESLETLSRQSPEYETLIDGRCASGQRRVLHVASQTTQVGGHTRTIENWVKTDKSSQHSLFITNQQERPLRQELVDAFQHQGGVIALSRQGQSKLDRALQLRRFSQAHADLIVLHHHANDVVPIVAFAIRDVPPVAILNHADHIFWLGSSIADIVINLREIGMQLSRERRATARDVVLPIPLSLDERTPSRESARQRLGIDTETLIYLSVGRSLKYRSTSHGNFFSTAKRILDRTPGAQLIVLGLDTANADSEVRSDTRFILAGEHSNSLDFCAAADVYLESFPFGSQTAALEAARSGLPLVLAFAPPIAHLATNIDCLQGIVPPTETESGYVERAVQLAAHLDARKEQGTNAAAHILKHHVGEGWRTHLTAIYAETDRISHCPRTIPVFPMQESAIDRELARWQFESSDDATSFADFMQAQAYALRNLGHYRAAFSVLRSNLASRNLPASTILAIAKLVPHWLYTRLPLSRIAGE